MKLSIYSIIKNEEKEIEEMLKSVVGADELVVCIDSTSTDKSEEIARKYTDKIYSFVWEDSFAKAKNEAASRCSGDWVMSIDGDCRLEPEGIKKIKSLIENTKHDVLYVELESINFPGHTHLRGKIYRNNGTIEYSGRAHEDLNVKGSIHESGVIPKIYYGYSENHFKDPDRYIRILTKQVAENPKSARPQFYLAREFYYKKNYLLASTMFLNYLKLQNNQNERVEALFLLAKCYWYDKKGDLAREYCNKAILLNPDHRGVLNFMSVIHSEPWKSKWKHIANNATNKDVMFKT